MSKYPVETSDLDGVIAGVNYLLSGPAGLGQNFSGQSETEYALITGNSLPPFRETTSADPFIDYVLYHDVINLAQIEMLDETTYKLTFASTQPTIPFNLGAKITFETPDASTFIRLSPIGVLECTTDYVIAKWSLPQTITVFPPGGTVWYTNTSTSSYDYGGYVYDYWMPLGSKAKVTVNSETDRVFLSGQADDLNGTFVYISGLAPSLNFTVAINRYQIIQTPNGVNTTTSYIFDKTIVAKTKTYYDQPMIEFGLSLGDYIFTSFIDMPPKGYYLYSLEAFCQNILSYEMDFQLKYLNNTITTLTAQVVKQ